jgi:AcrR family transcriptional regulator
MNISIQVSATLYLKDPTSSEIGLKILTEGIQLMQDLGFEAFTFKKLAQNIQSTEATIYRYFENKHNFLLYLINWYWGILSYRLMLATANVPDLKQQLSNSISVLTGLPDPSQLGYIAEEMQLKQIVIQESGKALHTKMVDDENQNGIYLNYKSIVSTVAELVKTIDPSFPYPEMLISNLIENANQQRFFSVHLPRLTNSSSADDAVESFSHLIIQKVLQS